MGPRPDDAADALARRLVRLADTELAGVSPAYERIARGLAADPELLGRLAPLGQPGKLPVLVLAAVHDLVLAEPDQPLARAYRGEGPEGAEGADPWPPFRALLVARFDDVAATVAARRVQTNEVGRSAALVPALATAAAELGGPLALVEVGPSAGLNLLVDRWALRYESPDGAVAATWGDPASPVVVRSTLLGPVPPLPEGPLPLASREGIDLDPVDVTDPADRRWLRACLWPGVPERPERLAAALAVAAGAPPTLHRGDAAELVGPLVAGLPPGVVPVVVSTWALAYLPEAGRLAVHDALAEVGAGRDLALVTAEYPHVTPWLAAPGPREGATLVGLTTWAGGREASRPLAWVQAHGRWLDWLS